MANNCYNYISINGNKKQIKEFSETLKNLSLELKNSGTEIYARLKQEYPSDMPETDNDGRWFDMEIHEQTDEEEIIISGDSAWSPCLNLFTEISAKYKSFKIRYEYEEMGCDFSGWADIQEGEISDNEFTYWQGMIEINGEMDAMDMFICNELDSYESEQELLEDERYLIFSEESRVEILENYKSLKTI